MGSILVNRQSAGGDPGAGAGGCVQLRFGILVNRETEAQCSATQRKRKRLDHLLKKPTEVWLHCGQLEEVISIPLKLLRQR